MKASLVSESATRNVGSGVDDRDGWAFLKTYARRSISAARRTQRESRKEEVHATEIAVDAATAIGSQ